MPKAKTKSRLNEQPNMEFFQSHINKYDERHQMIWRFDDFTEKAQIKLCVMLKEYSRCWTVRKSIKDGGIDIKEIFHALRISNPIIIQNYQKGFYSGQMPAWREKQLSRLVYYLCRRNPSEETKKEIIALIETEDAEHTPWRRPDNRTALSIDQLNTFLTQVLGMPETTNQ